MKNKDKVATVIGVGPGLGKALVQQFGSQGFRVNMFARDQQRLADYQDEFDNLSISTAVYTADISDNEAFDEALVRAKADNGAPEVLIYNAAVLTDGKLMDYPYERYEADFKVNVLGALTAMKASISRDTPCTVLLTGGGLAHEPDQAYASLSLGKIGIWSLAKMLTGTFEDTPHRVATIGIMGFMEEGSKFDQSDIARFYWEVYKGTGDERTEYLFE